MTPSPRTLGATLAETLATHPDRCAVEGAAWVLSYRDLEAETGRLASRLRSLGVGSGCVVPLLLGRSPEFIVAALAVMRCGAAYAPIDLASPPGRRRAMLEQRVGPVWLTDGADDVVPAGVLALDVRSALQQPAAGPVPAWPSLPADTPLYVMFTSGSTGTPKGVIVPHGGVLRLVSGADYASFGPDARWGQLSSVAFDASTLEIWGPLLNGGCCVVQEAALPSLAELAAFIRDRTLTDVWLTSALFNTLVDDQPDCFAALRQLFTGGERVSPRHAAKCLQAHPGLHLINGYGPTENTTFSLCHRITLADTRRDALPIGRPIRGTGMRIADDAGREVAAGATGELWLCGDGLALGYLGDAERTREKFVVHDGVRWYRSGDRVSLVDGLVHHHGRIDRQVKLQGHRVELDEIEHVLCACEGVDAAAVLVTGDSQEGRHLVGYFSSTSADTALPARVVARLALVLPAHMLPHPLQRVPRLPLNINGKIDRQALSTLHASWSGSAAAGTAPGGPMPCSPTQAALADIWARALGLAAGRAGLHAESNFIALGGTSLLALKVSAEVRATLQRALEPVDVLRHPQLAAQARCIDTAPVVAAVEPRDDPAEVPLSQGQLALLDASRLDPTGTAYLVHTALQVDDAGDPGRCGDRWREAMREIARRHPMLRTCLRPCLSATGADTAVLAAELPPAFWTTHAALAQPPTAGHWPAELLATLGRPLDLCSAPMRVDHWPLAGGGALLVWTAHHHVVDEATVERIVDEWVALQAGERLPPVLGSAFAFPTLGQAWHDADGVLAQAERFAHLTPDAGAQALPPGRGAELPFALPAALAAALRTACADWACTPFTPLTVACGLAVQDTFGADWRFLLAPFSRRLLPELQEPAGYLVDVRLIEAGAQVGEPLAAHLARVHAQLVRAQQPRLQPVRDVAARLADIRPAAAAGLFRFAITWRQRGRQSQTPLRRIDVPQTSARFGLCLHLVETPGDDDAPARVDARLEALQHVVDSGAAERFRQAFLARLQAVLGPLPRAPLGAQSQGLSAHRQQRWDDPPGLLNDPPTLVDDTPRRLDDAPALGANPQRPVGAFDAEVGDAWTACLGRPPSGPDADYLAAGGTSLLALRMAAELRRKVGLELDVATFLARPTFAALCRSLRRPAHGHGLRPTWSLLGPHDFRRCVVLVPGLGGKAVGLFALANALRRRLPPDHAVVMADLHNMMHMAPPESVTRHLVEQLRQLLLDVGPPRTVGLAGYSLGGNLATLALQALGSRTAAQMPLLLVDSYANVALRTDATWLWRRRLVKLIRHPWHSLVHALKRRLEGKTPAAGAVGSQHDAPWAAARWDQCRQALALMPDGAADAHAVLIHSSLARRDVLVLKHLDRNGLADGAFASLQVEALDVSHGDMVREAADRVAAIIVSHLRAA